MVANVGAYDRQYEEKKDFFDKLEETVLHPDIPPFLGSLGSIARSTYSVAEKCFRSVPKMPRALIATQFTSAFTMPFDLFQSGVQMHSLFNSKNSEERLDDALYLTGDLSQFVDGAATFTGVLGELGAKTGVIGHLAPSFGLAASIASLVYLVVHSRGIFYSLQLLKIARDSKTDPLFLKLKQRKYHLETFGGVDSSLFFRKVSFIKRQDAKEQTERLNDCRKALKERISLKITSHSLGLLITAVSVAVSLIFFFTGVVPLVVGALALTAGLGMLAISKMALEHAAERRFQNRIRAA